MLSCDEAVNTILKNIEKLGAVKKPLLACAGHTAAENIYTDFDLPQKAVSGPDGYAVQSQDIRDAARENPAVLRIIATARAGRPSNRAVKPGTAIRIMTGSVVPEGADCVVRFEDTDEPGDKNGPNSNNPDTVRIYTAVSKGGNIRQAGNNARKGMVIVPEGAVIGSPQISALAAIGKVWIRVIRRPVVAIIATGDELIRPGNLLTPGKAYNCNTVTIASLVKHFGGIPRILGIARDKEADLIAKIRRGVKADVIITSGGVSKGDYDLVRLVLGKIGRLVFARIRMGPGAAVAFGMVERQTPNDGNIAVTVPVFSLSGPPAGCLINFETLVRPALLKMLGFRNLAHPSVEAIALNSVPRKAVMSFVKYTHLRETKEGYVVAFNDTEKMGMTASIAGANSLTIIPEGTIVEAGDKIRVLPLDWHWS